MGLPCRYASDWEQPVCVGGVPKQGPVLNHGPCTGRLRTSGSAHREISERPAATCAPRRRPRAPRPPARPTAACRLRAGERSTGTGVVRVALLHAKTSSQGRTKHHRRPPQRPASPPPSTTAPGSRPHHPRSAPPSSSRVAPRAPALRCGTSGAVRHQGKLAQVLARGPSLRQCTRPAILWPGPAAVFGTGAALDGPRLAARTPGGGPHPGEGGGWAFPADTRLIGSSLCVWGGCPSKGWS